jgi:methylated-DNA-[protein]-cysteine S-methyltransferase
LLKRQAQEPSYYLLAPSPFGTVGVVWQEAGPRPSVERVFLPGEAASVTGAVRAEYPGVVAGSCPAMAELGAAIQAFLEGECVAFDLDLIALDTCSPFQARVLLAEAAIPRGRVSTYGRIATVVGAPGGGRAVGRALARNPFPIVIPCHRAIRSNGELGGFQGGVSMKRALLEMEGVEFTATGRVLMSRMYY